MPITHKLVIAFAATSMLAMTGCRKSETEPTDTSRRSQMPGQPDDKADELGVQKFKASDGLRAAMKEISENPPKSILQGLQSARTQQAEANRRLEALLPATVGDLRTYEAKNERARALAEASAKANAEYERSGAPRLHTYNETKEESEAIDERNRGEGNLSPALARADAYYKGSGTELLHVTITDFGSRGADNMAHLMQRESDRKTGTAYEKTTTPGGREAYEKYDAKKKEGQIKVLIADRFVVEISGSDMPRENLKFALGKIDADKLTALEPDASK